MRHRLHRALRRARSTASDVVRGPAPVVDFVEGGVEGTASDGARHTHLVPPAWVDDPRRVTTGDRVVLMEGGTVRTHATGTVSIGTGVRLGRFAAIDAHASIEIGDDVSGSDFVTVTDAWGPGPGAGLVEPVVIGEGSYLGCSCVVGPGARVGRGVFVGEGAVVVGEVPDHSVVYGNPARVVRQLVPDATAGPRWA